MKLVLDTNILISATLWDGSVAQKILFKLIEQDAQIFISKDILLEYEKVLFRDFNYSKEEIYHLIQTILKFATLITPTKQVNIIKEDSTDNKIIECALESSSEYLLTYDKHLLKIKSYSKITILTPEDFRKEYLYPIRISQEEHRNYND